ncbi:pilus (MSHA type) biogenesis protein MshL [Ferrimonas sp. YFM]|uniref:pilus (MSHA type) biogenesis protein MshL n=1 Tax=Ferrimonas sp. YFM TaxID=3028878 RepID=UPI00257486FD|nr:pilus (MSHA type) biogenesis protein MshL [Ferrimonas sp. YFM]BDY06748.1 pilus (MSHA type) biogenesis protein MshL [Ferrimonas sp. YFM]
MTLLRCLPLAAVLLAGCQSLPEDRQDPVDTKQALNRALEEQQVKSNKVAPPMALPTDVAQELAVPRLPDSRRAQPLVDVAAKDVDAQVFFASLVEGSRYSVAVHPGVQGTISLNLKQVTIDEVLKTVEDIYGYDVRRSGRVLQVYPTGMRSETFAVNYLHMKRAGLTVTSVSSGRLTDDNNNGSGSNNNDSNSNNNSSSGNNNQNDSSNDPSGSGEVATGTRIETLNESHFWGELKESVTTLVGSGQGRSVVVLPQAGLVTVRANPEELRLVGEFLGQAQEHMQRQVILEARILEVRLNDGFQQGIQWTLLDDGQGASNVWSGGTSEGEFGNQVTQALGNLTSLTFSNSDFNAVINLLDTQGDVDTLSSPRVTATNNQKAIIKVGTDEYFVTEVSSTTTVAGNTAINNPEIELTPFFSGIALDVTPQISKEGEVLLHVRPSVSDISEQVKSINVLGDLVQLPLAQSDIRESDTLVRASSGDVVVIGGLMKTLKEDIESKVPLLGDIPGLGMLFTNTSQRESKTELVILLKPTVIENGTWKQQLEQSQTLIDTWYPTN